MRNKDQQRLFEHYNPLEDRIGEAFFESLPKKPGIYKMFGRNGALLYVGKAKNLRNRLFTYRRAKVGKTSRKIIRLIRMVHRIEYKLCENEKKALIRENSLIRQRRPEFNHAKKSPETYYFIHLQPEEEGIQFKLNMHRSGSPEWQSYGAFKGHNLVRSALGALLRLLYVAEHAVDSMHHLPSVLLKNLTPMNYRLPYNLECRFVEPELVEKLFAGTSDQLFEQLMEHFQKRELLDRYIGKLILEDMEAVQRFYENCSHQNHEIAQHFGLESHIIPQQKLDDYLIELAFSETG